MSVRQRAVDLLYAMCDRSNAEEIVSEMLSYLETADYSIREEMVCRFRGLVFDKSVVTERRVLTERRFLWRNLLK